MLTLSFSNILSLLADQSVEEQESTVQTTTEIVRLRKQLREVSTIVIAFHAVSWS